MFHLIFAGRGRRDSRSLDRSERHDVVGVPSAAGAAEIDARLFAA
jgi:hypothetical protein